MVLRNPQLRRRHAQLVREYKIQQGTATDQDKLDYAMSNAIQAGIASGRNPFEFMASTVTAHRAATIESTGNVAEGFASKVADLFNVPAVPVSIVAGGKPEVPKPT